jgi:nicotinamidase/pyrazinamidase
MPNTPTPTGDDDGRVLLGPGDALLLVDLQRDFMPGGALGVPDGDRVIEPANACIALFVARGLPVIASRDWHPVDHVSFAPRGGPWPVHCVAGSPGAGFDPRVALPAGTRIVSKATERDREAYSAFDGTWLRHELVALGVRRLFIAGLATDYCVRASVHDALRFGLAAVVLRDAVCPVDVRPGDGDAALQEIADAGARLVGSRALA